MSINMLSWPSDSISQNPRLLDDVSFHPCVRFKRWEAERILSFIPPDGNFRLLSYHVSSQKSVFFFWFFLFVSLIERNLYDCSLMWHFVPAYFIFSLVAIPVYVKHNITFREGSSQGRFDLTLGPKQTMGKAVESVLVSSQLPRGVLNANLNPSQGTYTFDPVTKVLWNCNCEHVHMLKRWKKGKCTWT